jgi:LmbE family N-acetylglucosaminyl deacetylase
MAAINCTMVITAHMDDECLSAGGLIQNRIASGHRVVLLNVFGRVYNYGQGRQYSEEQHSAWDSSCKALGLKDGDYTPLGLPEGEPTQQSYYSLLERIEYFLGTHFPTEVVIHDDQDRNQDHRWLSDVCKIALRPWSVPQVKRVLMMQSPDGLPKLANYYVPLLDSQFDINVSALEYYAQEQRNPPHPRSIKHLDAWLRSFGGCCNSDRAEPYRLYFAKE